MKRHLRILTLITLSLFMGCEFGNKENPQPEPEEKEIVTLRDLGEVVDPLEIETRDMSDFGLPFEAQKLNDSTFIYQGDIMIDVSQKSLQPLVSGKKPPRKSAAITKGLWPNNTLYYQIAPDMERILLPRIRAAIEFWEENSNITFIEEVPEDGAYIEFVNGSGCSSYVGRLGGKQYIRLATACSTGNTMHEIAHALGMWHEQSRSDRDKYVKINWDQIKPGYAHNFKTYLERGADGQDISEEFDFGSIMMYPAYSFNIGNKPTITRLDGSTYSVQRRKPSALDIEAINKLYPAHDPIEPEKPVEPTYENGAMYQLNNVWVYRNNDKWYHFDKHEGWREVELRNGYWYYLEGQK